MANIKTLDNISVENKKILMRVDVNVPMASGFTDDTRLRHILPTVKELLQKNASVILVAHFGRPKGKIVPELTLAPVAEYFGRLLGQDVLFPGDTIGQKAQEAAADLKAGQVMMLENIRFEPGEEKE